MQRDNPETLGNIAPGDPAATMRRDYASGIVAFATVLALLHFGREVLIPFTTALMLSLLLAPLVRALRRIGLGQTLSVLAAVAVATLALTMTAAVLGTQLVRIGASLPQYQQSIREKAQRVDQLTTGWFEALSREAGRLVGGNIAPVRSEQARAVANLSLPSGAARVPVAAPLPTTGAFHVIGRVLSSVWSPLQAVGIVLVVLVFVLLEYEALRDRFIRVAGATNIRLTTLALNEAGELLSRYFASQFLVNVGIGVVVALGLAALRLPHATLWGALAALLRFVPYIGIWIAALLASSMALAVAPGWSLAIATVGLFALVEFMAGQAVEPHLYGHNTGLSPLSVILAAIFWSALWGPIGLILSTPLTLCLLVIGRYTRALSFLELLLADTQALTLPQKFYQRALSGDSDEILAVARAFLKRNTFAAYCDAVLIPALHLAHLDFQSGSISKDQQMKARHALIAVVSALSGEKSARPPRRRSASVLDDTSPGHALRLQRERLVGRGQGPLAVPPGSITLCLGLDEGVDVLTAELLVRALRDQAVDAHHVLREDLERGSPPPGASQASIAMLYVVSAFPGAKRADSDKVIEQLRQIFPGALIATVFLPGMSVGTGFESTAGKADYAVSSFVQAVKFCLERQAHGRAME